MAKLSVIIDASKATRGARVAVKAIDGISKAAGTATKGVERLEKGAGGMARGFSRAGRTIVRSMRAVSRVIKSVIRQLLSLQGIVIAVAAGLAARKVIQYADAWQRANRVIGIFVKDGSSAAAIQQELADAAQRTGQPIDVLNTLFQRMAIAQKSLGVSTKEMLRLTEDTATALALMGADAGEARFGLRQFSQALGNGVLRAEEFNGIIENTPSLAVALADGLGVTTVEFRKMALQGLVSSKDLVRALQNVRAELKESLETAPLTIGIAFTRLNNSIRITIGQIATATGAATKFANIINTIGEGIGALGTIALNADVLLPQRIGLRPDPVTEDARFIEAGTPVFSAAIQLYLDTLKTTIIPAFAKLTANAAIGFVTFLIEALTVAIPEIFSIVNIFAKEFASAFFEAMVQSMAAIFSNQTVLDAMKAVPIFGEGAAALSQAFAAIAPVMLQTSGLSTGQAEATLSFAALTQNLRVNAFKEIAASAGDMSDGFSTVVDQWMMIAALIKESNGDIGLINDNVDESTKKMSLFGKLFGDAEQSAEQVGKNIGQAFGNAFSNIITGVENIRDAFANLAQSIFQMLFQAIVASRLQSLFGNLLAGFAASTPTDGSPPTGGGTHDVPQFAQGGAFMGGEVVPFAQGGIIDRMGIFPLSGGRVGVAGEAGPEAFMEVTKLPGGKLGVAGGGGGGDTINIAVTVRANNPAEFGASSRQMRRDVERSLRGVGRRR